MDTQTLSSQTLSSQTLSSPSAAAEGQRNEPSSLSLPWHREILESLFSFSALSQLLRLLGAGVIIAALSIYLMQGWQSGDDLQRYLLLLTHTGLLAGIGFACSHWLREPKGARLFLSLTLISASVNFAVLGALLYSLVQWDSALVAYPPFAKWQADSPGAVLATTTGAIAVMLPIVWIGFLALARRSAGKLTAMFMVSNALLLLPVRSPELVGLMLVAATIAIIWLLIRNVRQDSTLATTEGRFAQAIQILPLVILALRGLTLYAADAFLISAVAFSVYLLLRQTTLSMSPASNWRRFFEQLSLVPAAIASAWITISAGQAWPGLPATLLVPVFAIGFSGMIIETSLRSPQNGPAFRRFASVVMMLCMVGNLALTPGVISAMLCLFAGIGVLVYGFSAQQRTVFVLGLITFLIGLAYQLHYAITQFDLGSWGALAMLGISAILIGSVLERHGPVLKKKLTRSWGEYRSWDY